MLKKKKNSFGIIAHIKCLPENAFELRQHLFELVKLTRNECECLSCEIIENESDPTEFTLLEKWLHEEAHIAHLDTKPIKSLMKSFSNLLTGELDLRMHILRSNMVRYGTNSYCLAAS